MKNVRRRAKRAGVGFIGVIILLVGIVAIPYPGPGWLIVFAGLAILATEFTWAQRLLGYARGKYDAWTVWLKRQPMHIKALFLGLTTLVVVVTLWLMNGYGIMNDILHLHWDWLRSPFLRS
jgi:uncharacterized protein (TIGR02611 family)